MHLMRLFMVVLLAFAIVSATGCGSEPAPIAPKSDAPLSKVSADGTIMPATPPSAPAAAQPAATVDEEEEE
jgi:hypothetical protein